MVECVFSIKYSIVGEEKSILIRKCSLSPGVSLHVDGRYSILWKDEDSPPLWLSRSDLISVCGKAWLDKKTQEVVDEQNRVSKNSRSGILEEAWKMDLEYLTDMKSKGLHPDTQKPLRESDRKTMPWLFQTRTAGGEVLSVCGG
jgi:hypothetical protein